MPRWEEGLRVVQGAPNITWKLAVHPTLSLSSTLSLILHYLPSYLPNVHPPAIITEPASVSLRVIGSKSIFPKVGARPGHTRILGEKGVQCQWGVDVLLVQEGRFNN